MRTVPIPLVMAGLAFSGCILHTGSPPGSFPAQVFELQEPSPHPQFAYQRAEIRFQNHVLSEEETSLYRSRYIRFPSIGDNGQVDNLVSGKYYESKLPGQKPLVIVLLIWGGHVYPSEKMTAFLKRRSQGSVNVFQMVGEKHLIDWDGLAAAPDEETFLGLWRQSARRERTTTIDIRRTIDWAESRSEVDTERIGLLGFSHGAVVAAAVTVHEPRLAATVLVMPGALAHEVLARCPLGRSEGMREKALSDFQWSLDELEARLEPIFRSLDPANYPGRVDPSRVLMIDATEDECMPETGREALWQALGRPERIRLKYGHQQAFLTMTPLGFNWLRYRIGDFLDRVLSIPPVPEF